MTWNDAIPAVTNSIAADIPDIEENFQELLWSSLNRSQFTYNGGATAYTVKAKAALYSCKDKFCYWTTELTTAAIGAPAASTWYYLYLDYSGITSGTAITNSEFAWSDTAPTFDTTYRGWYNGDDRCIFAVLTDGTPSNIKEFFHYGNYFCFADEITSLAKGDIDTTWTDATLNAPGFCTMVNVKILGDPLSDATAVGLYWRTNGQTGTAGHLVLTLDADLFNGSMFTVVDVLTDSAQKIEVKMSGAGDHQAGVTTNGWYFPIGM